MAIPIESEERLHENNVRELIRWYGHELEFEIREMYDGIRREEIGRGIKINNYTSIIVMSRTTRAFHEKYGSRKKERQFL